MLLYAKSASTRKIWLDRLVKFLPEEVIYQISSFESACYSGQIGEGFIIVDDFLEREDLSAVKRISEAFDWTLVIFSLNSGMTPKRLREMLGEQILYYDADCYEKRTFENRVLKPQVQYFPEETCAIEVQRHEIPAARQRWKTWFRGGSESESVRASPLGKRLCLAFLGEAETAYEMGAVMSELYQKEVLIMDLDRFLPSSDTVTGVEIITKTGYELLSETSATGLNILMDCAKRNSLSKGVFERCAQQPKGLKGLKIITGVYQLDAFEYYQDEYLKAVIDKAVRFYDYVLLKVNDMPYDIFTLQSFLTADRIVAALPLSINRVRAYKQLKSVLCDKQGIEERKHVWIASGCENLSSSDMAFYSALAGAPPLGKLSTLKERTTNQRTGKPYCHKVIESLGEVYKPFIETLFKEEQKTWDY